MCKQDWFQEQCQIAAAEENNQFSFNIVDHVADRYLELQALECRYCVCVIVQSAAGDEFQCHEG